MHGSSGRSFGRPASWAWLSREACIYNAFAKDSDVSTVRCVALSCISPKTSEMYSRAHNLQRALRVPAPGIAHAYYYDTVSYTNPTCNANTPSNPLHVFISSNLLLASHPNPPITPHSALPPVQHQRDSRLSHPQSPAAPPLRARVLATAPDVPRAVLPPIHARPDGAGELKRRC